MAYMSPDPWLSRMLRVPRYSPRGRGVLWSGGGGAVWRLSWTCMIGWVRQMSILVGYLKNMSHIDIRSFYGQSISVP